jgi:hypothetical protein
VCLTVVFTAVGDPVCQYQRKEGNWQKLEMHISNSFKPNTDNGSGSSGGGAVTSIGDIVNFYFSTEKSSKLDSDGMFDVLHDYSNKGYILAAGSDSRVLTEAVGKEVGLVSGHAYTILGVYKPKLTTASGIKLLKLRNPWGKYEWAGAWSDGSAEWKKYPGVKMELQSLISRYQNADDGVFYISWDDFLKYFVQVDVCMTTSNTMTDLQLDTCEDFGKCGGVVGCVTGCIQYWMCCVGLYKLWWNNCCMSAATQAEQNGGLDLEMALERSKKAQQQGGAHAGKSSNSSSNSDTRMTCHLTCCTV